MNRFGLPKYAFPRELAYYCNSMNITSLDFSIVDQKGLYIYFTKHFSSTINYRYVEMGEEGGGSAQDAATSMTNIHRRANLHF